MRVLFIHGLNTIDEVLLILSQAQEQLHNGGMIVNGWTSEGTSVQKFQGMRLSDLIEACILFLQQEDPTTYGKRVTRTKPAFR